MSSTWPDEKFDSLINKLQEHVHNIYEMKEDLEIDLGAVLRVSAFTQGQRDYLYALVNRDIQERGNGLKKLKRIDGDYNEMIDAKEQIRTLRGILRKLKGIEHAG